MSTNVDLSKVKIHPQKRKNGIQVYCTWCFDDGTKNGIKERISGYGKTEAMAKNKLKENIQKKQDEYTYGAAIEFGDVTVKKALHDFLKREKNGEYISKKTGKPKTLIAVEHDYETANALLFPCTALMSLQLRKVKTPNLVLWQSWVDKLE